MYLICFNFNLGHLKSEIISYNYHNDKAYICCTDKTVYVDRNAVFTNLKPDAKSPDRRLSLKGKKGGNGIIHTPTSLWEKTSDKTGLRV